MVRLSVRSIFNLYLLIILLLVLAAYVSGLFVDVTRDASKYATIAREVYETHDYINLKAAGEPYLQKPPLMFWLSALSFSLFGVSNWAFKLPVLIFSLLGMYALYRLGRSLYDRRTGALAAIMLGSMQISFLYNMDIHTDTLMQAFVTFSVWQFADFIRTNRNTNLILGFSGVGLAMLTKGPVGAVVPAFAVTGYILFSGKWKLLKDYRWYLGSLMAMIFTIPALIGLFNQFGWEGIKFFLWTNNAGRLAGDFTASNRGIFFYVYNLIVLSFPWTFLVFSSIYLDFRQLLAKKFRESDWIVFSATWFFFIILSFSRGKLPNYLYVLMPFFALVTAKFIIRAESGEGAGLLKYFKRVQQTALFLLVCLIGIILCRLFPPAHSWQWLVAAFMLLFSFSLLFFRREYLAVLIGPSLVLSVALNFIINQQVAPQIFSDQAPVKAAEIYNRRASPGENLYNYNYWSHELFFYGKNKVRPVLNDLTVIELLKEPGNWVFTTGEVVERLPAGQFPKPEIIPLSHVWINRLNFKYLNPATRASARDTLFLLRSVPSLRDR